VRVFYWCFGLGIDFVSFFFFFEAEPPAVKELLAPDETVINPYYMRQLLQYGIKLGEAQSSDMTPEALLREAEVSGFLVFSLIPDWVFCSDWSQNSSRSSHSLPVPFSSFTVGHLELIRYVLHRIHARTQKHTHSYTHSHS
jgi:hypothetical protein